LSTEIHAQISVAPWRESLSPLTTHNSPEVGRKIAKLAQTQTPRGSKFNIVKLNNVVILLGVDSSGGEHRREQFAEVIKPDILNSMEIIPMQRTHNAYTVQEVTQLLRTLLVSTPAVQNIWVEGEISNVARPASGHLYFTLKDEQSQIRCVIFRGAASQIRFPLKNGDAVLVHGKLDIYDQRSEYQIIGDRVEAAGVGTLQLAFERLKEKLAAEGLFDPIFKKQLPKFPQRIGVITSGTGAAIRDILQMLQRRYPVAEVLLFPTLVQGDGAAWEIAHAIRCMNRIRGIDVLIVGRGGGSLEDLWAFNEEPVARAIFASQIPVVSAVGHETDVTIADYVADQRAPTPTAAVELIVPDQLELNRRLNELQLRLTQNLNGRIDAARTQLQHTASHLAPSRQIDAIHRLQQMVDSFDTRLQRAIRVHLRTKTQDVEVASSRLGVLNPLSTLGRGYSVCRDSNGQVITDAAQVEVGDEVEIQLLEGRLGCRVLEK
jgi:exodeoxyribonuclease VII large subunit